MYSSKKDQVYNEPESDSDWELIEVNSKKKKSKENLDIEYDRESDIESDSESEDGLEYEINIDENGDPNLDLSYNIDIRDSIIDYGQYISDKIIKKGHKILEERGWCEHKKERSNSITEVLWDYKLLEGHYDEEHTNNFVLKNIKKVANFYRRGVAWLFCVRLQKGKRWILHRYLKKFIHEESCKRLEEKLNKGMTLSQVRKLKKKYRKKENYLVNKIINRCIYIPRNASRYEIRIESFERVETIITEEVGSYLDLDGKFADDSWVTTKKNIRNGLIALFTSFGILDAVITGVVLI